MFTLLDFSMCFLSSSSSFFLSSSNSDPVLRQLHFGLSLVLDLLLLLPLGPLLVEHHLLLLLHLLQVLPPLPLLGQHPGLQSPHDLLVSLGLLLLLQQLLQLRLDVLQLLPPPALQLLLLVQQGGGGLGLLPGGLLCLQLCLGLLHNVHVRKSPGQLLLSGLPPLPGLSYLVPDSLTGVVHCLGQGSHPLQSVPVTGGLELVFLLIGVKEESVRLLLQWRPGGSSCQTGL